MVTLEEEARILIVCSEVVNLRSSWDLRSQIVYELRRGDILCGDLCIEYCEGLTYHTRVRLDDGSWTSMSVNRSTLVRTATQLELDAAPSRREQLVHIWQLEEEIRVDR